MDYKLKYVKLSCYCPKLVHTQKDRCRKFINGLSYELQNALLTFQTEDFNRVMSVALQAKQL